MMESAKITSKNQITLPARVRKTLGIGVGDKVDFVATANGTFELRSRKETLADLRGVIKPDQRISSRDIERWIKEARSAGGEVTDDRS
ncbi:AbrB/MazE/SpoVT family DNA-binding domain-containing protein [Pararhizobium sp. O133]|uniref:AbrB/MazE/SpoVT family DNA-binding domain-containing protein n=1 Tax=Pararhizobium sp. O133 TaxID=3449278 RepID=UPI003F68755E